MRLLLTFLIAFIFITTFSQEYASIDVDKNGVKDIQSACLGDSVFIAVDWFKKQSDTQMELKKGYWILPDGTKRTLEFGFIERLLLCGVEKGNNDTTYYYFLDFGKTAEANQVGAFLVESAEAKNAFRLKRMINRAGSYLGSDRFLGLTKIFFLDSKKNSIIIKTLKKGSELENYEIEVPFDLGNDVTFIGGNKLTPIESGQSKTKIYFRSNTLSVVSEEKKGESNIFTSNIINGEKNLITIPSTSKKSVLRDQSFLVGKYVYKFTVPDKEIHLNVYDANDGRQIYEKALNRLHSFRDIDIFGRIGVTVTKQRALYSLLNPSTTLTRFMIAETFGDQILIIFGSYSESHGSSPMFLNPYNLVGSVAAGLILNAVRLGVTQPYGISKYTYLSGNPNSGFILKADFEGKVPVRHAIDQAEWGKNFSENKVYQVTTNGVVGIYHSKKEGKIRLVKYLKN